MRGSEPSGRKLNPGTSVCGRREYPLIFLSSPITPPPCPIVYSLPYSPLISPSFLISRALSNAEVTEHDHDSTGQTCSWRVARRH